MTKYFYLNEVPLSIVYNSLDIENSINITNTPLLGANKSFINNQGTSGVKLKFEFIIKETEEYNKQKIISLLDSWIINGNSLTVVTNFNGVKNGLYQISKLSSKTEGDGLLIYSIELIEDSGNTSVRYITSSQSTSTTETNSTLKKTTTSKQNTTKSTELDKCNPVISKNSSKTECVKLIQSKLKKLGFYTYINKSYLKIDGRYGTYTVSAMKQFQTKYKKKYNLVVNGNFDEATKKAMVAL